MDAPRVTIRNSVQSDVFALSRQIGSDDTSMRTVHGMKVRRVLRDAFKQSPYCRTALVGDEVAAMWGVAGSLAAMDGHAWVTLGPIAKRHSIWELVRYLRQEMARMGAERPKLFTVIADGDATAERFASIAGFKIGAVVAPGIRACHLRGR